MEVSLLEIVFFKSFEEASEDLLEIVNSALPGKTIYLAKRLRDALLVEKVLDNGTGVKVKEGDTVHHQDTY